MAERRMFAKTIIDSDAFIDMPVTSRLLYYDLAMRADDDGFVNSPKKIMRMIGASEDDLKLLIAKQFIIPFESGIVVIKHWKIHNYIRKDMYHETKYKDERSNLYLDKNNAYTLQPCNGLVTDTLQPCNETVTDLLQPCNELVTNPLTQDRIGKDRIGKDRIEDNARARAEAPADEKTDRVPYKKIMELYHSICVSYPKIRDINGERKKNVSARYKANPDLETFKRLFEKAEASKFLQGNNDRNWKADFDFMMHPAKFDRILEGKYDDAVQQAKKEPERQTSYNIEDVEERTKNKYLKYAEIGEIDVDFGVVK